MIGAMEGDATSLDCGSYGMATNNCLVSGLSLLGGKNEFSITEHLFGYMARMANGLLPSEMHTSLQFVHNLWSFP